MDGRGRGRLVEGMMAVVWGIVCAVVLEMGSGAKGTPCQGAELRDWSLQPKASRFTWPMRTFSHPVGPVGKNPPVQAEVAGPEAGSEEHRAPGVLDLPADLPPAQAPVITALALDQAHRLFATAGDDHLIRIWELPDGRLQRRLAGHRGWVRTVAFSPDGQYLATGGDDRCLILFRVGQSEPVWKQELAVAIYTVAFSPDGRYLAAAGFSEKIWLLEATTGRQMAVWTAAGPDVRALAFSPDGAQLAAGARNGILRRWQVANGLRQQDLAAHQRRIRALAYSPDGQLLVSGGEDGRVVTCNPVTGQNLRLVVQLPASIFTVVFCSPDRLAVGTTDNRIRLVRVSDGRLIRELVGHTGTVAALAWESSTQTLISGGFDTTVRFWQLGAPVEGPFSQHTPPPANGETSAPGATGLPIPRPLL